MASPATTIEALLKDLTVVHKTRIRANLNVYIGQAREGKARSQYLCLVLHDDKTGRFIALKLSTFRKLVRWVAKKDWLVARRLTLAERLRMDFRDWWNKRER
jgi:hypothetical protein